MYIGREYKRNMREVYRSMKLLLLIPVIALMFAPAFVLAGGPRYDAPEDNTPEVQNCYREGWE